MPVPYGMTMKGKADRWLRENATGRYVDPGKVAKELGIKRSAVLAALRHHMTNGAIEVIKLGKTYPTWWIGPRKGGGR